MAAVDKSEDVKLGTDFSYERKIIWKFVVLNTITHTGAFYGLYLMFYAHFLTTLWGFFVWFLCMEGITMGVHRLFAHRSFKATLPVRIVLVILHTVSGQFTVYRWVRDHRVHHKYTDTDADPHNASRGFFFSHYGWLMLEKHPLVHEKAKEIDISDLKNDKVVMFQKEHFLKLHLLFGLIIPVAVPMYFWDETFVNSLYICYFLRFVIATHCSSSVNSFAHFYGTRPYDKSIRPADASFTSYITNGEGWHNYHHVFPWDYRSAELGNDFNLTAKLIDLLARFGLVYDLKTASPDVVKARMHRTGDGTHRSIKLSKYSEG